MNVNQPSRKGDGPFVDGDYWVVAFSNTELVRSLTSND